MSEPQSGHLTFCSRFFILLRDKSLVRFARSRTASRRGFASHSYSGSRSGREYRTLRASSNVRSALRLTTYARLSRPIPYFRVRSGTDTYHPSDRLIDVFVPNVLPHFDRERYRRGIIE